MMTDDETLFELTSANINSGLRGVPVGTCLTSFVTPNEGVHYCGYPIAELAMLAPEDVIFLLYNKELPTLEESVEFRQNLQSRGTLPDGVEEVLKTLPIQGLSLIHI